MISWVEKYHPTSWNAVLGDECTIQSARDAIKVPFEMPHIILHGPPGTGKSSTADCIIHQLFPTVDMRRRYILKLNASKDRSLFDLKKIEKFANMMAPVNPITNEPIPRIIILDEAESMTEDLQWSMRQLMESVDHSCRFIFICNCLDKIVPPIQSRCFLIHYPSLRFEWCYRRLAEICDAEHVEFDDYGVDGRIDYDNGLIYGYLEKLMELCERDMRRTLNTLQIMHSIYGKYITVDHMHTIVGKKSSSVAGLDNVQYFLSQSADGNFYNAIHRIIHQGYNVYNFTLLVVEFFISEQNEYTPNFYGNLKMLNDAVLECLNIIYGGSHPKVGLYHLSMIIFEIMIQ